MHLLSFALDKYITPVMVINLDAELNQRFANGDKHADP